MDQYVINEIYYTIHGEGVRYGIPHVFVRFSLCNLACDFCDTEFESGRRMSGVDIVTEVERVSDESWAKADQQYQEAHHVQGARRFYDPADAPFGPCRNVLFCGGEPLLQLDSDLIQLFHAHGWHISVETNGTRQAPDGIDWITCSPKVAEHAIKLQRAHELKYVRAYGQGIPRPRIPAEHYLISPMFEANNVDQRTLDWCVQLVKDNPSWRLTIQHHKINFGGVR